MRIYLPQDSSPGYDAHIRADERIPLCVEEKSGSTHETGTLIGWVDPITISSLFFLLFFNNSTEWRNLLLEPQKQGPQGLVRWWCCRNGIMKMVLLGVFLRDEVLHSEMVQGIDALIQVTCGGTLTDDSEEQWGLSLLFVSGIASWLPSPETKILSTRTDDVSQQVKNVFLLGLPQKCLLCKTWTRNACWFTCMTPLKPCHCAVLEEKEMHLICKPSSATWDVPFAWKIIKRQGHHLMFGLRGREIVHFLVLRPKLLRLHRRSHLVTNFELPNQVQCRSTSVLFLFSSGWLSLPWGGRPTQL